MKVKTVVWLLVILISSIFLISPVLGDVPVANFISNTTSGTVPLTVQFVDSSQNTPTSWTWLFGDGGMSTDQNPTHTYLTAGTYTVTLIAKNFYGSNTVTENGYITASKAAAVPVVSFVTNITSGNAPLSVQFLDSSTNSPSSWVWSFGDGGTATSYDPIHTYTTAGQYTVTLTATNSAGSNTTSLNNYIDVTQVTAAPTALFKATVTQGYEPLTVQFVDVSTNSPNSWVWSFGDGGTSTLENPVHTYTASGTFEVTLTASNAIGSSTETEPGFVVVNAATPAASFSANVTSGTYPLTVQFTDTSNDTPTGWYWTFGDGGTSTTENPVHTYTANGAYTVSLGASNTAGSNTSTMPAYINVSNAISPPVSSFFSNTQSGPVPLSVMFHDTSSNSPNYWQWSFGDGALSSEQNPVHTYTQSGSYTVTLTTQNDGGSNTTTIQGDIIVSPQGATAVETTTLPITTLAAVTQQPTAMQTTVVTTTVPGSAGTSPSWTLPLIVVVILVLVVIALVLRRGGQSGGRRRYRRGDL
ncbi:PKD domain-containing protein [Methanoregula sp.]|uniref:PKD domain-containing protein n=1 Tax=Methanoregula sp. TaxID=2052170 RepID=UPI003BB16116